MIVRGGGSIIAGCSSAVNIASVWIATERKIMSTLKSTTRSKPPFALSRAKRNKLLATLLSYDVKDLLVAEDSKRAFRRFLKVTQRLCNAGSAGLSMLRRNAAGQDIIRWEAISGALASHEGAESLREASPCGRCLDSATTTLLSEPQSAYPCLAATLPAISQDLIVPLYDELKNPVGTLWLAHHDLALRFGDAEVHVAEQLGMLLSRVLHMFEHDRGRQQCATVLESRADEKRVAADDLFVERTRREHAEASECKIRKALVFKEAEIQDAHHRVKNTIQIAANYLQLQAQRTASSQVSVALLEGYSRLHLLADAHELLYKGSDGTRKIPMRDLLETVAGTLAQSFSQLSERVVLRTAIEPIFLDAETAIPLASLANEAATNAYKHAFTDGRTGEVSLTLRRTAEAALVLQISDNGLGLKSKTVRSTLGLDLIHTFAAQLGGTLVLAKPTQGSGTTLTLTIPAAAVQTPPA
jgi:two-component sensor histidine kinase